MNSMDGLETVHAISEALSHRDLLRGSKPIHRVCDHPYSHHRIQICRQIQTDDLVKHLVQCSRTQCMTEHTDLVYLGDLSLGRNLAQR